jgi:hypothetical protein
MTQRVFWKQKPAKRMAFRRLRISSANPVNETPALASQVQVFTG